MCAEYGWPIEYTVYAPLGQLLAMRAHLAARRNQPIPGPDFIARDMSAARKRVAAAQKAHH